MQSTLLFEAEAYVTELMGDLHKLRWPFHNIDHIRVVVDRCKELAEIYKLSLVEREEILLAAWFHDTGYTKGAHEHEMRSAALFISFLEKKNADTLSRGNIVRMIMATKYPSTPTTLQEKILCDADLFHLSLPDYFQWSELLLQETNIHLKESVEPWDWDRNNISFFTIHHYFTDYAIEHWLPGKIHNLELLQQRVGKK